MMKKIRIEDGGDTNFFPGTLAEKNDVLSANEEISERIELGENSRYWMKADVKKDKEGDTIVVLYIGQKGDSEKVQEFSMNKKESDTTYIEA